jgi:glucuronokinase
MIIKTKGYARAGLLGNPSDGYFGKTISISVKNFAATISLYESPELKIEPQEQDKNTFKNMHELAESVQLNGYYGGERLIKAAITKFYKYILKNNIKIPYKNFTIRYYSSIPRQVGLAGSSAIITATIRALMQFYNVKIKEELIPSLILSVETDELGITAGLQDRVIQVYEGCMYMDFDKSYMEKNGHGIYERINSELLTNLYLAYKTDLSEVSGVVHNEIKTRYNNGESLVVDSLNNIAECAELGRRAIENKNIKELNELINLNFDLRCKIMNISESNREMVDVARSCGASAKFCGSGGAIIGMYENEKMITKLIVELKKIKVRLLRPYIL